MAMFREKRNTYIRKAGMLCIAVSLVFLLWLFFPAISSEMTYQIFVRNASPESEKSFREKALESLQHDAVSVGIVIPKIEASAPILLDVDPFNKYAYRNALKQGVAHASNSAIPGESGNAFLFAHSSDFASGRYNSIFYRINKLETDDEIIVRREDDIYVFLVTKKTVSSAQDVQYLDTRSSDSTITLMTCWPIGTTQSRLLVFGRLVSVRRE